MPITHLTAVLRPPDLVGHVSLSLGGGGAHTKDLMPTRPIVPFQRVRDAKSLEAHEILTMLPHPDTVRYNSDTLDGLVTDYLITTATP